MALALCAGRACKTRSFLWGLVSNLPLHLLRPGPANLIAGTRERYLPLGTAESIKDQQPELRSPGKGSKCIFFEFLSKTNAQFRSQGGKSLRQSGRSEPTRSLARIWRRWSRRLPAQSVMWRWISQNWWYRPWTSPKRGRTFRHSHSRHHCRGRSFSRIYASESGDSSPSQGACRCLELVSPYAPLPDTIAARAEPWSAHCSRAAVIKQASRLGLLRQSCSRGL